MSGVSPAREAAFAVLCREDSFSHLALKQQLAQSSMDARDRALTTALVYGVLCWRLTLDTILQTFCDRKKTAPKVWQILRLGVFQLRYLDKIPAHSAVNESVVLAKRHTPFAAGFVNGVLRRYLRTGFSEPDRENLPAFLSVEYSFPTWLVGKWCKAYGAPFAEELMAACNQPAPMTVRIAKEATDEVLASFEKRGMAYQETLAPQIYQVTLDTAQEPLYQQGKLTVMQPSSMLACVACQVQPHQRVLDLCAAPGGKTLALAERCAHVTAWELHPHRAELIRKNAERMKVDNVTVVARDATQPQQDLFGTFDVVLLDAPCSGLGVIRQKPDVKWKDPDTFRELSAIQKQLILMAANYVRPGGALLYATCTLNRAENEQVADFLLEQRPDFCVADTGLFPEEKGYVTLFPHLHQTNGFFIARLERRR